MSDLAQHFSDSAGQAFAALGLSPALAQVKRSDRPELADFQCNGAMAAAKAAGKPPRALAEEIVAAWLKIDPSLQLSIAGPGFINIIASDASLAARAQAISTEAHPAAVETPRRVIVDYGGPNVAKGMHVGHLRASIIGESVKRLFRFRGDEVWGDAHFGDWGFQMGLMLCTLEDEIGGFDDAAKVDARMARLTLDDLETMYPASAARAKQDDAFRDRARKATAALQGGDATYRRVWRAMHAVSMAAQKRDFASLNVDFDLWKGESDADPLIPEMVADLKTKGLLELDQGAQIVRIAKNDDKREMPPLLVISSEGSAMYGTTDLATILDRVKTYAPDLMLYVVDQRQADHFEQVFRAAVRADYIKPEQAEHIGFGTMNGADGKPFKTRAGGVLKLNDLIEQAREKARARLREAEIGADFSAEEFEDVAHKVAIAAIKFADLSNFRGTSYVFDLDRFMSFEGKTGPYLLYQAVRIKSILRKAEEQGAKPGPIAIAHPAERALALALDAFEAALRAAYDKRAPHFLAEHAFDLAQAFSGFYGHCPILPEKDEAVRAARLALAAATLRQLEQTLDLLGFAAPERM